MPDDFDWAVKLEAGKCWHPGCPIRETATFYVDNRPVGQCCELHLWSIIPAAVKVRALMMLEAAKCSTGK